MENLRSFAQAANVANTLNGGMAKPRVTFSKEEDHYRISLCVAGTGEGSFKVEIINQSLYIFLFVDIEGVLAEALKYPLEILPIPSDVDFHNIGASYEGNTLHVRMPFNELANGYRQGIDIMR
jgi:HSP20 family molecular chaperone IbpA